MREEYDVKTLLDAHETLMVLLSTRGNEEPFIVETGGDDLTVHCDAELLKRMLTMLIEAADAACDAGAERLITVRSSGQWITLRAPCLRITGDFARLAFAARTEVFGKAATPGKAGTLILRLPTAEWSLSYGH